MKTQSPDTSLDAELVLIGMIRKAPMSRRFAFVQAWTASMLEAGSQYVRQLHPQASDEEARLLFIERQYGKDLADELRWSLHAYHMQVTAAADYQRAIRPLAKLCEELDIPYALSGSLASSLYGLQRATLLHQEELETAIRQKTCLTLVHLESLLKVTVTLPGMLATGRQVFHQARKIALVEGDPSVSVLSPEQLILLLLEAFKRSNERADDLWYDLLGIMKVQGTDLDLPFLIQQAAFLGVAELFTRALVDAGLRDA